MLTLFLIIGGKTSISLFGSDYAAENTYQKSSQSYAPPATTYKPAPSYAPSYSTSAGYGHAASSNENSNPYTTSQASSYGAYAPASYQKSVTTFGASKAARTEHNLGADGEERSSVKVHHPPGGSSSFNLFGGPSEPMYTAPKYKAPAYEPPKYEEPPHSYPKYEEPTYAAHPSYEEPEYDQPPTGYGYGYSQQEYSAPPTKGYYGGEEQKHPGYGYSEPAPKGFTSSSAYGKPQVIEPTNLNVTSAPTFGRRVESGMNSGPTTGKPSTRVHAPPGGKSSIFF